ncbi:MAG: type II secretion system protein N [Burkholderiales bacterium]|nr:type II secretion system protein N [Burkholderiales bacterium]
MRRAALFLVFLVALVVAGAAFVPTAIVDGRLAALTDGTLHLTDASGTLWRGSGTLGDAAGTWRAPLAWRLDPAAALRGTLHVTLLPVGPGSTTRGTLVVHDGGFAATDVSIDLPAAALAALLPPRTTPTLGGTLALAAPTLAVTGGVAQGSLDVRWSGARIVLTDVVADLGTVHLAMAPQGQALVGALSNDGGNLRVEGTLTYRAPALAVDATLTPAPDVPAAVTRALAAAGTPDANGRVRVAWRGNLR